MYQMVYDLRQKFTDSMDDDFNVSAALASLFKFIHRMNKLLDRNGLSTIDKKKVLEALNRIDSVLGVLDLAVPELSGEVKALIERREKARTNRDWGSADRFRQELKGMGIEIIDTKNGPVWRKAKQRT
jgi:cysteinyl-tRNA synthetase